MASFFLSLLVGLLAVTRCLALSQQYCSTENTGSGFSSVYSIYMSDGLCQTTCQSQYAFAVVQYQTCWCSNYIPAQQASISNCNENCPGYPQEQCGNENNGYFGYIALTVAPSGTAGASSSSSTSTSTSTSSAPSSSSTTTQQPTTTQSPTTSSTVVPPSPSSSTPTTTTTSSSTVVPPSPFSTTPTTTIVPSSKSTSLVTSPVESSATATNAPPDSETTSSPSATTTPANPVTTRIVTVSGSAVTQTVTSTPETPTGSASSSTQTPTKSSSSNHTGAIVGGVIGGLAFLVLLGLLFFFLWRRRQQSSDPSKKMSRNASVLSKAGLIGTGRNRDAEKQDQTNFGSQRRAGSDGDGTAAAITSPAATYDRSASGSLGRSNSRPLVYDQRLNPVALMDNWQHNGSQTSVNTIDDQRDYSRPLGVTNPDPEED